MTMLRPLLLVCHEATRTGGARVITELFEHTKPSLGVPLAVELLAGGPLEGRLRALADVDRFGVDPIAVVVNSALAADALWDLHPTVPALLYVHEEGAALRGLGERARAGLLRPGLRIICVSETSRLELQEIGVDPDAIVLMRPLVGTSPAAAPEAVEEVRRRLVLGTGDHLVLACGEASWRKGADLFVDVARRLAHRTDVALAWVGRRPRGFARKLDRDVTLGALTDRITWTGEVADAASHLAAADLLLMTSREDPQPLVPLEAALDGTPTVAFAVSGLEELGRAGAALTVPYPDTGAMADAVEKLLFDRSRADELVQAARGRAALQSAELLVPAFAEELRALLRRADPSGGG